METSFDHAFMQLLSVTLALQYPGIAGTCLGIQFCTLWCARYIVLCDVQGTALKTAGDIFLVSPRLGPHFIS